MKRWLFGLVLPLFFMFSCSRSTNTLRVTVTSLAVSPSPATAHNTPTLSASPVFETPTLAVSLTPISKKSSPVIPTPSSTSTPLTCWSEGGQIEKGSLPTDMLPEPLDFRVYLPPCYTEQPERRYPVLYLIHGQSSTDDQWDRLGADEVADALIAAGEVSPFLIVMPRDRRWSQPDEDKFGQAVAEVLIPWIDAHYRTIPDRAFRAIGGLSRGAGWAVHLALSRWELFGALGAHSLPVFWTDTYHIKEWLNAIPPENMPRVYMDNPNNDRPEILNSSMWFEKLLTQRGIPHEWHLFTGYHDENYWESHMEQYLKWYAEPW